ncbi:MAG: DUF2142 domain-containing protein [Clostridia bacterium]
MKKILKNNIFISILIIFCISILIEGALVLYGFFSNKVFSRLHLIDNNTIEIGKDNIDFILEDSNYNLKVKNLDNVTVYNICLDLKKENQDVYMRVLFNNDAKFMPKENKNATKFKVYFLSGIQMEEFAINFSKDSIDINNIEKVEINSNIEYLTQFKFSFIRVLCIFLVLGGIYLTIKLFKFTNKREINIKEEKIFLCMGLIFGLTFVFINLPQVRYDEHAHLWKAYELASGKIISSATHEFPSSLRNLFENEDGSYPNRHMTYETIKEQMNVKLDKNETEPMSVGYTGSLTPISYMPQMIGAFIGKLFNAKPIILLWIVRIFNLIAYITLIYWAIKLMPSKKWKKILLIISLFPMSLNLAASSSPDAVILSWTLLAIAYTMKLKYSKENINVKQTVMLGIMYMIPAVCKVVYIPLVLLFWTLPKDKFKNSKERVCHFILCSLIVVVPYLVLNKIAKMGNYDIAIRANALENLLFTFADPLRALNTVVSSVYSQLSTWLFEMIGGWNTVGIISIIILLLAVFISVDEEDDDDEYKLTKRDIIIIMIIIAIEVVGVIAAMYIGWTQAKETVIDGVQGRYFLPIIPLIMILANKHKIKLNVKNKNAKFAIIMGAMYLCICIYTIVISI